MTIPRIPAGKTRVYYQYCAYFPDHEGLIRTCIRRGVDVAPMHVDVCTQMELFGRQSQPVPGAEHAMTAVQVPVYELLSDVEIERIGRLVREEALKQTARTAAASNVTGRRAPAW